MQSIAKIALTDENIEAALHDMYEYKRLVRFDSML